MSKQKKAVALVVGLVGALFAVVIAAALASSMSERRADFAARWSEVNRDPRGAADGGR